MIGFLLCEMSGVDLMIDVKSYLLHSDCDNPRHYLDAHH